MGEYIQFPKGVPTYAMVWMHGLGASGDDMKSIVDALNLDSLFVHHVFMEAPKRAVTINQGFVMPAWYDIFGTDLHARDDVEGIESSSLLINEEIKKLTTRGYKPEQILLAGFSQGAAMALYTSLNYTQKLAGVVALSGYLPLVNSIKPKLPTNTPFFIAYGRFDSIVMPTWSQQTAVYLNNFGYTKQQVEAYPMEHNVCPEEVQALSKWIKGLGEE